MTISVWMKNITSKPGTTKTKTNNRGPQAAPVGPASPCSAPCTADREDQHGPGHHPGGSTMSVPPRRNQDCPWPVPSRQVSLAQACTYLLLCLLVLGELTGVGESRWLAGSGRRLPGHHRNHGSGHGGPRSWRRSDPGIRGQDVCPTRRCRCQRRLSLWHMHCTLPLTRLPRFRKANFTLETATIARRNLTKIPKGGFRSLPVRHLDLSGNLLTSGLPGRALQGLGPTLESLSLANCYLPKVPSAALTEVTSLRVLHLEYNVIVSIRAGSFKYNVELRDLSLYGNQIYKLDRDTFQGLGLLDKLRLSHNALKELQRKMFFGASNITSLDVSDNLIKRLGSGAFRDLRKLKWLELGGNDIAYLTSKHFQGLRNLKYLKLDRNPLLRIQDRTFATSRRLRYLSLDISNVTTLTNLTLKGLTQLKTFYIGEMGRANLPDGIFGDTVRLKFLSLSDYGNKFLGLTHRHFSPQMNMRELSIWILPIQSCTCHTPWIKEITGRGAYVHGQCADKTPISCRRRHRRKGRRRDKEV